ncbi:hypothetical protein Tsubulata_003109 [Turnera subulata]|uniref:Heat shock 70 kDa protein 16 n=1 Tax=Turnera subulata TaxID=218843 RepID=A0A9Q0FW81_9ROSI|nr:hypothetical protein Tsubulata_003109 [Turnera subulata]
MSVVGFDIGNENCVIAVARQRGIDVLLNDESNRETPAAVSFCGKQRLMGSAGAASLTMNPRSTVSQVKRLIGRKFDEPELQNDLRLFPFETAAAPDGGILIRFHYLGEIHSFSPVHVLGMLFSHLKQIAEKNLETPVSECVIGVPSYFTDLQRRSYLDAAAIAGLRPLRLMHDCTATALGYGIYKNDLPSSGSANVVFVDIGHCDTQVCLASFEKGEMRVLSHAFDANLGGRDFDEVLFRFFAERFKEQYGIDVCTNVKASIRLRASCEKLKKVLSANAEAPLNIECLMDEKDVKGFIKRDEFESLSSSLLERIGVPCRKVLQDSGLSVEKIHSVELVGSASRIPAIGRILASIFKREPSRTINASECVARGCAIQCAMLSPIFRVREYEVQDSFPFSIGFSSDQGPICTLSNTMLFPKGQLFPSVKIVALHRTSSFCMEAYYADENELPYGVSSQISNFMIGPFQSPVSETARLKVRLQLNLHGIVSIESAVVIDDDTDTSLPRPEAHPSAESVEARFDYPPPGVANGAEDAHVAHSAPSSISSAEMSKRKMSRRLEIPVSENVYGRMTNAELSEAKNKELWLAQQDLKMEKTKEKKNALESYVYEMRDKIFSTYESFTTDLEREEISRKLQQIEEWLYEEGDDESEDIYAEKLEDLKKHINPIENRYKDDDAREKVVNDFLNRIKDYQSGVGSLPAAERDAVMDECSKAERWLQDKIHQQNSRPKSMDPILWSTEIKRKAEAFEA